MILNKERINVAMANACMNPGDLCKEAGITYQTYHRIISGKPCKTATAGKIASVLNVRAEDLIDRESENA